MKEKAGLIMFVTGLSLLLYFLYWVDMWLHIVVGGGHMTMYSTVGFWGAQAVLEGIYMHHLTIFLVGITLTTMGGFLSPQVEVKRIPMVGVGMILLVNGLWGLIWLILELGLPPSLYHLYVEVWSGRYYAWGYHPSLPVLWWDRLYVVVFSLASTLIGYYVLLFVDRVNYRTAGLLTLSLALFVGLSNLVTTPIYTALTILLTATSAIFLLNGLPTRIYRGGIIASIGIAILIATLPFTYTNIPMITTPYGVFTVEHIPGGVYKIDVGDEAIGVPLEAPQGLQLQIPTIDFSFGQPAVAIFNMKTMATLVISDGVTYIPEGDYFIYSIYPVTIQKVG